MLRIHPILLELVRSTRPLVKELERRDADLARQCIKSAHQRSAQCGRRVVFSRPKSGGALLRASPLPIGASLTYAPRVREPLALAHRAGPTPLPVQVRDCPQPVPRRSSTYRPWAELADELLDALGGIAAHHAHIRMGLNAAVADY